MRYILTIIIAAITFIAKAQAPTQQFNGNLYQYNFGHYIKGSAFIPRDTVSWVGSMGDSGRIAYKGGLFWGRDGSAWRSINMGINSSKITLPINRVLTLRGDSIISFGDSYTIGVGASQTWLSYLNTIKETLGIGYNNLAISGTGSARMQREAYVLPLNRSVAITSLIGLNDLWRGNGGLKTMSKIKNVYTSFIANSLLKTAVPASDASVSITGTWSIVPTDTLGGKAVSIGGNGRSTNSSGATLSYSFTGNSVVVGSIGVDGINKVTRSFDITIDGINYGIFNYNNATDGIPEAGGVPNSQSIGVVSVFTNLPDGSHTVVVTSGAGTGSLVIDYIGTLVSPQNAAPIYISEVYKLSRSGYAWLLNTLGSNLNDEAIGRANDSIASVINRFQGYPVTMARGEYFFNPEIDIIENDIHPNDTGHYHIAQAFMNVMVRPGIGTLQEVTNNGNSTTNFIRSTGNDLTPTSGTGIEMAYNPIQESGFLFSYDRSAAVYKSTIIRGVPVRVDIGNVVLGSGTDDGVSKLQIEGITKTNNSLVFNKNNSGPSAPNHIVFSASNGLKRWGVGTQYSESGSGSTGSDLNFFAYNDAGGDIGTHFIMQRANGFLGLGVPFPKVKIDAAGAIRSISAPPAGSFAEYAGVSIYYDSVATRGYLEAQDKSSGLYKSLNILGDTVDISGSAFSRINSDLHLTSGNYGARLNITVSGTKNSIFAEHSGSNFAVGPLTSGGATTKIENTGGGGIAFQPSAGGVIIGASSTPTSTLNVSGSFATAITTVTGTTTLNATHYTLKVNNSADVVVNLPAASGCTGRIYVVKKISNNAFTVTVTAAGSDVIDGSATDVISAFNVAKTYQSDGTTWSIL
jgi:hypothetical protein